MQRGKQTRLKVSVFAGTLLIVIGSAVGYKLRAGLTKPETPKHRVSRLTFEPTPARLERGRYLVEGPAHCFQCHSEVAWQMPGAPPKPRRKGAGTIFPEEALPWLIAPNITPDAETGAGAWTDEQLARAIREGIGHDGRRLFPMMPYLNFRRMADEDLASVIVYLRSIEPVRNVLPKTTLPEPVKNSLPPLEPISDSVPSPDWSSPVKRGEYLVRIANCGFCHTPMNEQGQPMANLAFAGGMLLKGPWGEVTSANITPDPSGISYYDVDLFLRIIRTGHVGARKLNSIMPWGYFRRMTDEDLKAIFAYLRTLPPVKHRVDNTEPATACKLCGGRHGYGERN
jgi:mono/diheme cytochrome c family protein